jgi:type IV/VI secretion system ImpK/VasF family protein
MPRTDTDQDPSTVILTADRIVADDGRLAGPGVLSTSAIGDLDAALRASQQASNALIAASSDLIGLVSVLHRIDDCGAVGTTRAEIGRAIIDLKYRVVQLDYPPSVAENLCLLYAIVIDEFILTSAWGRDSGWENLTLVADLFGFRDGGDRFYEVADRALMQPRTLRAFIEIVYIFLKLGYRGRFKPGDDFLRDRLIGRLETALDLDRAEVSPARYGRAPTRTRAIKPPRSAVSKLIFATVVIFAGFGLTAMVQQVEANRVTAVLLAKSAAMSRDAGAIFVYSSGSGTTERRADD